MTAFEIAVAVALVAIIALACLLLYKVQRLQPSSELGSKLEAIDMRLGDNIAFVQLSLSGLREENAKAAVSLRDEIGSRIDQLGSGLQTTFSALGKHQSDRLDGFTVHLSDARTASEAQGKAVREELVGSFEKLSTGLSGRMGDQAAEQTRRFDSFARQLTEHRTAASDEAKALRDEVNTSLAGLGFKVAENLEIVGKKQADALLSATAAIKQMSENNEARQDALRQTVEGRLDSLRSENSEKLEQMRVTVDEKLQGTLEQRLGASFNQVNENLERVFKSVGEMQALATGVGDLKRVLSNVKVRGTWGEGALGLLLEQALTPEQYSQNVEVQPRSNQRVEFALKLPGHGDEPLWLPLDAKMPKEDYERLMLASEQGDVAGVDEAGRALERRVIGHAKDICSKYICPPHTTDFAVLFLPTEGLFAEVVRRPGLVDLLQNQYRVSVTGPTTLMAFLNSIRMGFRSLAIQQRSSEVWQVLAAVKTEFGKFGPVLDKVQKKLGEAQNVVETARTRGRAMDRKLRDVEALPEAAAQSLLAVTAQDLIEHEPEDEAAE